MRSKSLLMVMAAVIFSGCAGTPQVPITMSSDALSQTNSKIGLLFQSPEETKLILPGAACLLCIAVAAAANSDLSKHSKTLSVDDITALEADISNALIAQGNEVISIPSSTKITDLPKLSPKEENSARREFTALAERYGVDKVFVVSLTHLGVTRNYANYIAKGAPFAAINGESYLVDPKSDTYLWFLPVAYNQMAEGEWKEAPSYPGITNAYYRVVEQFRDDVLGPITPIAPPALGADAPLETPLETPLEELSPENAEPTATVDTL